MDDDDNSAIVTNDTYHSIPIKYRSIFNPLQDQIIASVMLIVGIISVIGNGFTIHIFRIKRKNVLVSEILLLNIAIVDLMLAVASYPAFIASSFSHHWIFGELGCFIYGGTCYFLGLATILSLTALAVFRFIKTCFPEQGSFFTVKNTGMMLSVVYVYSAVWSLVPAVGVGGYDIEPFGLSCTLEWGRPTPSGRLYIILVCVFCVFLPALTIFGSHLAIFCEIRRKQNTRHSARISKQVHRAEMQLYRVSVGVCFGFLVAWMPYACLSLWSTFDSTPVLPLWMSPIPAMLAKSSIAYNPFVYVMLNRRYRMDLIKLVREILHLSGKQKSIVTPHIPDQQLLMTTQWATNQPNETAAMNTSTIDELFMANVETPPVHQQCTSQEQQL